MKKKLPLELIWADTFFFNLKISEDTGSHDALYDFVFREDMTYLEYLRFRPRSIRDREE